MSQDKRPWLVECPTCEAKKNEPCVWGSTEIQVPHNKRYLAAGVDPYAEQPRAAAPKDPP